MNRRSVFVWVLPVLAGLGPIVLAGCGSKTPAVSTSTTEATVRGRVIVHGKPASGGTVWFDPANYRRKNAVAVSTDVTKEGSYEITTLIGENSVRYEGPAVSGDRELDGLVQGYTVEEGENSWDIVLPVQ
ncbi:hypothetical protein AB1L88_24230 [Tautonia sp. JC769]|uniref:hypothetical protein n=1 Tax=Tautonia sp. JC769 TaxID=3232135 RepID=UPI00345A44BB